jgi:hypothetical protein
MIAKENFMRKIFCVAGLVAMFCLAVPGGFARTPPTSKSAPGTIVIVFKDGHRQSFNLSDIARVEFPADAEAADATAPGSSLPPSRGRFLGKWEVGDGNGSNFFITLNENGDATKSMGDAHGRWVYVDGEAHISWDDGWHDAIRKVDSRYLKFAYAPGKSFADAPSNVTGAHNTAEHPI